MPLKKFDTYLSLCTQVYDLSKPKPPEDAYALYRSYVISARGPILEPLCGTGRFLLPLLEEGFDVQGFDASDHMLEALFAKANSQNLKPTVWKGFVEDLKRDEKYGLIFIPSGSICLISDLEGAKAVLKIFYDHLSHDGILVFEAETRKSVPPLGIWRGSVWHRPDGKMILLSQLATLEGNICRTIGRYELVENNKIICTEIEDYKIRIYEPSILIEILKEVGFRNVRLMKAFDRLATPDEDDEGLVLECKKNL